MMVGWSGGCGGVNFEIRGSDAFQKHKLGIMTHIAYIHIHTST